MLMIQRKSTKKVNTNSLLRTLLRDEHSRTGKYLIESERIFKDNAWELDDRPEGD